jgi:hypothetical protein
MPTYRSKSTKSCSFGRSRTCLNEITRDDVMIWTDVPTKWWRVRYRHRFRTGAKHPLCKTVKDTRKVPWKYSNGSSLEKANSHVRVHQKWIGLAVEIPWAQGIIVIEPAGSPLDNLHTVHHGKSYIGLMKSQPQSLYIFCCIYMWWGSVSSAFSFVSASNYFDNVIMEMA